MIILNYLFKKYSFHDKLLSCRSDDYKLTPDAMICIERFSSSYMDYPNEKIFTNLNFLYYIYQGMHVVCHHQSKLQISLIYNKRVFFYERHTFFLLIS